MKKLLIMVQPYARMSDLHLPIDQDCILISENKDPSFQFDQIIYSDELRLKALQTPLLGAEGASHIFLQQVEPILTTEWDEVLCLSSHHLLMSLAPFLKSKQLIGVWFDEDGQLESSSKEYLLLWSYCTTYRQALMDSQTKIISEAEVVNLALIKNLSQRLKLKLNFDTSITKISREFLMENIDQLILEIKKCAKAITQGQREKILLSEKIRPQDLNNSAIRLGYLEALMASDEQSSLQQFKTNLSLILEEIERMAKINGIDIQTGDLSLIL